MNSLSHIINSIKSPLLFIARTNFKKIDLVKDLHSTIPNLLDRALDMSPSEEYRSSLITLREKFLDFNELTSDVKRKVIEEALMIADSIESDEGLVAEEAGFASVIEDKVKALSTAIQYTKGVGPRIAELLKKKGILTVEDALRVVISAGRVTLETEKLLKET